MIVFILLLILILTGLSLCVVFFIYINKEQRLFEKKGGKTKTRKPGIKRKRRFRIPSLSLSAASYPTTEGRNDTLPNGYTRQDYIDVGWSDNDIEFWGLDQPAAPEPGISGLVIADMLDGKLDGDFKFPFS